LLQKNGKEVIQSLNDIDDTIELLGTIKLQRNIRALQEKLPKAKYREEARSQDFDHGSLNKLAEENEKAPTKRPKRPYSQHSRNGEEIVPIKVKKEQPSSKNNLEERPARKIVMENLVERVKPIRDRSPKAVRNDDNVKPPHYIVRPGRNIVDSRNNNSENVDPNRGDKPKEVSRQAYLINKYSSNNAQVPDDKYSDPKVLDRVYSNDAISKRAEDIVKKYYADAQALADRRQPLQEIRRPSAQQSNAADILERYNNIYNYKAPGSKKLHGGLHTPDISRGYLASNQLRQQVEQGRGVIRPSWWG